MIVNGTQSNVTEYVMSMEELAKFVFSPDHLDLPAGAGWFLAQRGDTITITTNVSTFDSFDA